MKKLISLGLFLVVFLINLDNSEAICCDLGCYIEGRVCCGSQGKTVGEVGCDPDMDGPLDPVCPASYFSDPDEIPMLGQCLSCGDDNQWAEDRPEGVNCNACDITRDGSGNPINSFCNDGCKDADPCTIDGIATCCPAEGGDSDNDGMLDDWELGFFGNLDQNPNDDFDEDGISNLDEYTQGTNPTLIDTNGDGIDDGDDDDGDDDDGDDMSDAWESNHGLDPNDPNDANLDDDEDGFTNKQEFENGTDPQKFDSGNPVGEVICNGNGTCEDNESCKCEDCEDKDQAGCLEGLVCSKLRQICSGDMDGDGVLNDDDVCIDVSDPDQDDKDNDCYLNFGGRSPLFGYCGDACEGTGSCYSPSGDKQCCDDFPGTRGGGNFLGIFEDCPGPIGCFNECFKKDTEGNVITYETGACIDGKRVVQEFTNGEVTKSWNEDCLGMPLVPFFSTWNILITVLILVGYYSLRKKY